MLHMQVWGNPWAHDSLPEPSAYFLEVLWVTTLRLAWVPPGSPTCQECWQNQLCVAEQNPPPQALVAGPWKTRPSMGTALSSRKDRAAGSAHGVSSRECFQVWWPDCQPAPASSLVRDPGSAPGDPAWCSCCAKPLLPVGNLASEDSQRSSCRPARGGGRLVSGF